MKNERMKLEIMYAIEDLRNLLIASGEESDVIEFRVARTAVEYAYLVADAMLAEAKGGVA